MFSSFFLVALLANVVAAHFQLQFPPPRGAFNEENEPTFCDGYNSVTSNRTTFPLSKGFFSLNSEHPTWTIGILLSNASNPTSFDNFTQVNNFFQINGEGTACFPFDLSSSNFTGLIDGQNVTMQIIYDGGDGALYQCADLTLSNNVTIDSSVSCNNESGISPAGGTGSGSGSQSGAAQYSASKIVALMGLIVTVTASL
ncbi:hypothetical protein BDQ17DRAFT_1340218 [Cyathus striatus]|nr:hypothetical protein BDQ17DRAFT_1340218 [Cyathus striatus]